MYGGNLLAGSLRELALTEFRRVLALVDSAPTACYGCSCRATVHSTLNVCIICEYSWCERCGGPVGLVPIPAFRCCHCLLGQYATDGLLLDIAPSVRYDQLTRLMGLVRGRMLLLSEGKRKTTKTSYASGQKALQTFATSLGLVALPLTPAMIMDWGVHGLDGQDLDSSTIKLRFGAVYDIYDYARTRLGPSLQALANPLRDPEVLMFGKVLGANYKKKSKARRAITIHTMKLMLEFGWNTAHAYGLWGRIRWTFLNLGMLRVGGLNQLIIIYTVVTASDGGQMVNYDVDSDVQVLRDDTTNALYIDINVDVDKNVNSSNRRRACIPDFVLGLNSHPVADLEAYILRMRPPSGGPLFARPTKKGFAKPGNASADIKRAFKQTCALSGLDFDKALYDALGTHSGRKSLAQWLWDDGHCRRIIADAGGWFLKRDAVDMYFKTARHIILTAVKNVGRALAAKYD